MGLDVTGIGAVSGLVKDAIDKIWPDKSDQEKMQLQSAMMVVQGQLDINKVEATNPSVFVSGWRPFIGWVCGGSCAWNWIGLPVAKFAFAVVGVSVSLQAADLTEMLPLLIGMLGMTASRTVEKLNGVARV